MNSSTGIRLDQINDITSKRYGFEVLDWDNHRDGCFIGKCSFKDMSPNSDFEDISELPKTLKDKSAEEIAVIFNKIFQKFHFRQFRDETLVETFETKSLNMSLCSDQTLPFQPIIFILGMPIT